MKKTFILFFILLSNIVSAQLKVASGAELHTFSTIYLQNTDLVNDGLVIADDHIQFLGNQNTDIDIINNGTLQAGSIGFSGNNSYSSQGVIDASILMEDSATLFLQNGNWNISSIIGETESRTITGNDGTFIFTQRNVGTSNLFGNLGFELLSSDVSFGETKVYRHYTSADINGTPSILRYYEIIPSIDTEPNTSANFLFYNQDLDGLDINQLSLYRSSDGMTNWEEIGGELTIGDPHKIEVSNLSVISGVWAIAESSGTLSINGNSLEKISLYPNPSSNLVYIQKPTTVILNSLQITDMSGKILSNQLYKDNSIDVSNLSEGLYMVTIETQLGSCTKKVAVKR